ncbi:MAG: flagellar biosynthesis protein FlhB [Halanaerobiaceae bacterium]
MPEENPTGEKTEEPTPKRKREAREEGQVAKSRELSQAFTLLGSFLVLFFLFANMLSSLQVKISGLLSLKETPLVNPDTGFDILMENIFFIVRLVAPIMLASAVTGLVINFIQVGPLFSTKSMQPKFSNINPISGFKNIFSMKTLVELIKSLFKAGAIAVIAYIYIKGIWTDLITMPRQGIEPALVLIGDLIFRIGITIITFLVVVGIADFIYQKWEHLKNLKMTKYEVKQERKEMEGDPEIKSKRKEKQRQFSLNRMMSEMEDADVVITNPTHIAVAIKFDIETMEAPVVAAKGEGFIAEKIKEKAEELGIEIRENKPLARALLETTEIGEEIPTDLYQAVAEILAFIYRDRGEEL